MIIQIGTRCENYGCYSLTIVISVKDPVDAII